MPKCKKKQNIESWGRAVQTVHVLVTGRLEKLNRYSTRVSVKFSPAYQLPVKSYNIGGSLKLNLSLV